eukprot:54306-Pelagomonas_calceolata.AAC.6
MRGQAQVPGWPKYPADLGSIHSLVEPRLRISEDCLHDSQQLNKQCQQAGVGAWPIFGWRSQQLCHSAAHDSNHSTKAVRGAEYHRHSLLACLSKRSTYPTLYLGVD